MVVHGAAVTGRLGDLLGENERLLEVNLGGTTRVVRWCMTEGVKRLIFISGALVYGEWSNPRSESDPANPALAGAYATSKYCGEQLAFLGRGSGCAVTVLRLSSLYGEGYERGLISGLIAQALSAGRIAVDPPMADAIDLLHVHDAARTIREATERSEGGLWNVGGGSLTSVKELVEVCARETKASIELGAATVHRAPRKLNWVNDARAREDLGHRNAVSLTEGIHRLAAWMRSRRSFSGGSGDARPSSSGSGV